jgi:hypothetical protein
MILSRDTILVDGVLRTEDRRPDPVDGPPDRLIPAKPLARRFP